MSEIKTNLDAEASVSTDSSRRGWLIGAGAAAAAAGVGYGWWRLQPHAAASGELAALWGLQFDTPSGGQLDMATFRGKPLIVNFWATWCPPCVEELPMLERFFHENASNGWQIIGLAIDQPSAVSKFLQKMPLTFPIGLAGLGGTELGKTLGNLTGGLPFTVVVAPDGSVIKRKMGKLEPVDLSSLVSGTA